jgi:hypothetical protein
LLRRVQDRCAYHVDARLPDGYNVTVKGGRHGLPEEQGFLRDVQATACE